MVIQKIWKDFDRPERMHRTRRNGERRSRVQPADPGSLGKWPSKLCVCVCVPVKILLQLFPKVFLETSGGATANPGKLEMAVCEYSQSTMIIHYYTSQQAHLFTSTCVRPS